MEKYNKSIFGISALNVQSRYLVLGLALFLGSCSGSQQNNYNFAMAFSQSSMILLNAPQMSCKSSKSSTPTDDVSALSMNLGKISVSWSPPSTTSTLHLIYLQITLVSTGVQDSASPRPLVAGEDLNCIVKGSLGTEAVLQNSEGSPVNGVLTPYTFTDNLVIGSIAGIDTTNKRTFSGRATALIYATIHDTTAGWQDIPIVARTNFNFKFQGVQP